MDLKIAKEPVFINEVVHDGQIEQGVEFDYVLPDYYPDVFKILKCSLNPCVSSYSVSGNQLYCDGVVYIKVLYLSRDDNKVNCIEQRYTYSKTIELAKPAEDAAVYITPKTDYCNCRAVSGRRIDVRGAISCKVKVSCARETDMITGVNGMGVETRSTSLNYCGEKLIASRQFVAREDIETGSGSLGIASILHRDASVQVTDYKIIANKIVVKGEATVKALYLTRKSAGDLDNSDDPNNNASARSEEAETMEASIPVSQIIDVNGITDRHVCFVNLSVMDCDLEVKVGGDNEAGRIISCDLTLNCMVAAHLEKEVSPVVDMYSTDYESSFAKTVIKTETMPQIIERQLNLKGALECAEGNLESVFDARCDISNVVCKVGKSGLTLTGQASMQALGRLDSGTPVYMEKTEPFELTAEVAGLTDDVNFSEAHDNLGDLNAQDDLGDLGISSIEPNLQATNVTYSISSDNKIDLRIILKLNGCLYRARSIEAIKDITVNAEAPKQKDSDYALKLYYAEENEEVWNIAKRYNTGAEAIIAENDMESDRVTSPCMLLIPIV